MHGLLLYQRQSFLQPDIILTRAEAKRAFYELRQQASDLPEMSLDEINAEISAARAERRR